MTELERQRVILRILGIVKIIDIPKLERIAEDETEDIP
jgi:hypothetical protein